jgi:predicted nucleotidyltransferase
VQRGTVRCRRVGPRRVELDQNERAYLRDNWDTFTTVAEVLRTERNVRLAVIFGSIARGEADQHSDVDLLVSLVEERPMYTQQIAAGLEAALEREVDVASLRQLRKREPSLLNSIVTEGRVVIDRDGVWSQLVSESGAIERAASRARAARHRQAAAAVANLIEDGA